MSKLKERWTCHFVDALSFSDPLRGDDLSFVLESIHKNFPNLSRIQDLETYTSYKKDMTGSRKLNLLKCIIYLSYATPTPLSLGNPSNTVYLLS